MPNKHENKIIPNFFLGIVFVTTGILLIFYVVNSDRPKIDKDLVAGGIVVLINAGLFFWGSAFVHKVKSDLIRKQKHRHEKENVQEL